MDLIRWDDLSVQHSAKVFGKMVVALMWVALEKMKADIEVPVPIVGKLVGPLISKDS